VWFGTHKCVVWNSKPGPPPTAARAGPVAQAPQGAGALVYRAYRPAGVWPKPPWTPARRPTAARELAKREAAPPEARPGKFRALTGQFRAYIAPQGQWDGARDTAVARAGSCTCSPRRDWGPARCGAARGSAWPVSRPNWPVSGLHCPSGPLGRCPRHGTPPEARPGLQPPKGLGPGVCGADCTPGPGQRGRPSFVPTLPLRANGTAPATRQSRGQGPVLAAPEGTEVRGLRGRLLAGARPGYRSRYGSTPGPWPSPLPPWVTLVLPPPNRSRVHTGSPKSGFHCRRGQAPLEQ